MSIEHIDIQPTKELFIYMLTRDVKLEKAIIDLIDNSIDAAINNSIANDLKPFTINIEIDKNKFSINDNCGGIDLDIAKEYAFKFGRPKDIDKKIGNIGQFGIGMKRTIFKLGKNCLIESKSKKSLFSLNLNIEQWKSNPKDWTFDLNITSENDDNSLKDRYTNLEINDLYGSVSESFNEENFINELKIEIEEAHAYSLARGLNIFINGRELDFHVPELKSDDKINIYKHTYVYYKNTEDEVTATIYAGLTDRDLTTSGWYIYCNNRLLVSANQNMTTGWGSNGERNFHHDYAFFRGYVFFESKNGDKLPWTTTKDGINFNSDIYQAVLVKMQNDIKPILDFLKDLGKETTQYNKDPDNVERKIYEAVHNLLDDGIETNIRDITSNQPLMIPIVNLKSPRKMGTITFSRPLEELREVKKFLGVDSYKKIGEASYEYYTENEMEYEWE
ncbi:MAG: hypothetical protein DRG78_00655 [Epsilonproteobacteria bacterium]|nr:MAG: hypothetical protein DRG78_00655 [Campylobacterota bacterium]